MICEVCGEEFEQISDEVLCPECEEYGYERCDMCGEWSVELEYVEDCGQNCCSKCLAENFIQCDFCEEYVSIDDCYVTTSGKHYCPNCADDHKEPLDYEYGYLFAVEAVNFKIVTWKAEFRKEVFESFLNQTGMTAEKFFELANEEYEDSDVESLMLLEKIEEVTGLCASDVDYIIGPSCVDGELVFHDVSWCDGGSEAIDLLECLGFDVCFSGYSNGHGHDASGVYYVEMDEDK